MGELLIKELLKPIISSIVRYIKDDTNYQNYIDIMQRLLLSKYKSKSRIKNLLHSTRPVSFNKIYYPLKLKMKNLGLEEYENEWKDASTDYWEVKSVKSLFGNFNNISIFGNAGSGKSTLVNFLYLNAVDECYKYPILIYLRDLNHNNLTLVDIIIQQTLGQKQMNEAKDFFNILLEEGHFLFFFDGFDEVSPNKQFIISSQIRDLVTQYPQNKYVLTSRPMGQLYTLDNFHNYEIAPLDNNARDLFIRKQFPEKLQYKAELIINEIYRKPELQYEYILNTPLLVVLCILTFNFYPELPEKRIEFYERIFDTLFQGHDWLSKFGFKRDRKCINLSKDNYVSILSGFSYLSYFESKYSLTKKEVLHTLETAILNNPKVSHIHHINLEDLFIDYTVNINILISDGNYYCLPHKSFQEYYTANFVISQTEKNRSEFYHLFSKKFFNKQGVLLTSSFLSMLFEMDKLLFLKDFVIPALSKAKEEHYQFGDLYNYKLERVSSLLVIVNTLLYGKDRNLIRDLFAMGKIAYHFEEIDALINETKNVIKSLEKGNDFLKIYYNH